MYREEHAERLKILDLGHVKMFALSLAVILGVSLFLVLVKFYSRVPLHIPGHSAVYMLPIMMLGKLGARSRFGGTGIGFTSGIFAVGFGIMGGPLLAFPRFLLMGVMTDVVLSGAVTGYAFLLCGALANLVKVLVGWVVASAVGIPAFFIQSGMTFSVTTHLVFGVLGGLTAFALYKSLTKAREVMG